jgi:hypothetical protein
VNSEQIKRKIYNLVGKAINSIAQNEAGNTSDIPKTVTEGAPELICNAGIEGSVLLRNDGVLPFQKMKKSLFSADVSTIGFTWATAPAVTLLSLTQ